MGAVQIEFAGRSFFLETAAGKDLVAKQMASGGYEAPLPMLTLATLVRIDGAFIDVGANNGLYSILACLTPNRKVVAFEPLPTALDAFRRNLILNEMTGRVTIHEVALSDRKGTATLHIPSPGHGLLETSASLEAEFKPSHSIIDVPVQRLDDLDCADFIGLMKVDIEGHEHAFLRGARATILRDRPIIFAEIVGPAKRGEIGAFLHSVDYMDFRLRPDMAIHDGEVLFDDAAWNHALIPNEKLLKFKEICDSCSLPMLRRFHLS
jgi:FkbM family methyltransferase